MCYNKTIIIISFIFFNQCENPTESKNDEYHVKLWNNYYSIEETDTLILKNKNLNNEISNEIGRLYNLRYLDLSDNNINGQIPIEFFKEFL